MAEIIAQIQFSYSVPVTWLVGGAVVTIGSIAQVWALVKNQTKRIEDLEQKIHRIDEIAETVHWIKGFLDKK